MVVKRKRTTIDGIDRDILRTMVRSRRLLNANQISKNVKLTPAAIRPRLDNLRSKGIIKPAKISGMRTFNRTFGKTKKRIRAPRSIFWDIDLKKNER